MLRKLFQYDFSASIRTTGLVYAALIVAAVLGGIVLNLRSQESALGMVAILVITVMVTAVAVLTLVHICNRFEKNLFSSQGYLMHTLPVRPWQLIASKLLVALLLWVFAIIAILIAVSLLIIGVTGFGSIGALFKELGLVFSAIKDAISGATIGYAILSILDVLAGILNFVLSLYAACTVGHAVGKARTLVSVATFFALHIVESIITGQILKGFTPFVLTTSVVDNEVAVNVSQTGLGFSLGSLILTVVFAAAYFALTEVLMRKRLNLE